jgi:pimeloyl-ACP methyl ester carboxylesterase
MITGTLLGVLLVVFLAVAGGAAAIWKQQRASILKWSLIGYLAFVAVLLFGIGPYLAAWVILHSGTRGPDRLLKDTPADYRLPFEDISFEARDGLRLSGWFVPPSDKNAVVICTHGLFRNRIEVLARIVPLVKAGYGALLYDSRSHGASEKGLVSLGYYERNDVLGAIDYLQGRYQDAPAQPRIVLMGVSMGAVASLEAAAETPGVAALMLDSPFASLKDTIIDHSWLLFRMPRYTLPSLFLFWFQRLGGLDGARLDSHEALRKVEAVPVLIISSEGDRRIGPEVARMLFNESCSPVKKLEIFGKDVSHGAAARLHPDAYARVLLDFLNTAMTFKAPSAAAGCPR